MPYTCADCGAVHDELPTAYFFDAPHVEADAGAREYARDGELLTIGDDRFILANIEIPLEGSDEPFVWTCWLSLSEQSYARIDATWETPGREDQEPAFGWLCNELPTYEPSTQSLKTMVYQRPVGERPWVELEPTDHPLAVEQREGMTMDRVAAVHHAFQDD